MLILTIMMREEDVIAGPCRVLGVQFGPSSIGPPHEIVVVNIADIVIDSVLSISNYDF